MKRNYISPASTALFIETASMLASSPTSFTPSVDHETEEQYSSEKQFDSAFDTSGEWE